MSSYVRPRIIILINARLCCTRGVVRRGCLWHVALSRKLVDEQLKLRFENYGKILTAILEINQDWKSRSFEPGKIFTDGFVGYKVDDSFVICVINDIPWTKVNVWCVILFYLFTRDKLSNITNDCCTVLIKSALIYRYLRQANPHILSITKFLRGWELKMN